MNDALTEQVMHVFSRFDPPGLWESEPRSSRSVMKGAGER
ncbi:hypothetical protein ABIC16_002213 [Sphingomonas sp. PvP055]